MITSSTFPTLTQYAGKHFGCKSLSTYYIQRSWHEVIRYPPVNMSFLRTYVPILTPAFLPSLTRVGHARTWYYPWQTRWQVQMVGKYQKYWCQREPTLLLRHSVPIAIRISGAQIHMSGNPNGGCRHYQNRLLKHICRVSIPICELLRPWPYGSF